MSKRMKRDRRRESGAVLVEYGLVVAGIALSLARILYDMANLEVVIEEAGDGDHHHIILTGSATVVSLPKLAGTLEELPNDMKLVVHLDGLDYIDHACLDLLMNWEKQHEAMGGSLSIDWEGLQARFGNRELQPRAQTGTEGA